MKFIFNLWSSFFLCIYSKWSRREGKKTPHAPFCKMLHPINVKTLKRLSRSETIWLVSWVFLLRFFFFQHFSFHSLFRWESFLCLFFFLFCFKCPGGEEIKKYIHKIRFGDSLHSRSLEVFFFRKFAI